MDGRADVAPGRARQFASIRATIYSRLHRRFCPFQTQCVRDYAAKREDALLPVTCTAAASTQPVSVYRRTFQTARGPMGASDGGGAPQRLGRNQRGLNAERIGSTFGGLSPAPTYPSSCRSSSGIGCGPGTIPAMSGSTSGSVGARWARSWRLCCRRAAFSRWCSCRSFSRWRFFAVGFAGILWAWFFGDYNYRRQGRVPLRRQEDSAEHHGFACLSI